MVKIPGTPKRCRSSSRCWPRGSTSTSPSSSRSPPTSGSPAPTSRRSTARQAAGQPIDRIASVASFFVSRVDTLVDKLLDEKIAATSDATQKGWLESLKGKAAIANAKLAYQSFEELFSGAEWDALAAAGADVQRPLWASTRPRTRPSRTPCTSTS